MGVFLFYAGASLLAIPLGIALGLFIFICQSICAAIDRRFPSDPVQKALRELRIQDEEEKRERIRARREDEREARRVRRAASRRRREEERIGAPRGRHFEP